MKATSYLPPPATAWAILFRSILNHSLQLLLARSCGYMQMKSFQLLLPLCKPILDNFSVQSYCMSPTDCSGILIPSPRNHALVSQVFATFSKSILRELLFQFIHFRGDLPPLLPEHFICCYLSPCTFQFFSLLGSFRFQYFLPYISTHTGNGYHFSVTMLINKTLESKDHLALGI